MIASMSDVVVTHGAPLKQGWRLVIPSLKLRRGRCYLLTGGNMSGKSTLLRVLARQHQPVGSWTGSTSRALTRAEITVLLSAADDPMFLDWSVVDNVLVAAPRAAGKLAGFSEALSAFIAEINAKFSWAVAQRDPLSSCSKGARALVQLARAVVFRPSLYLIDEITANLDEEKSVYFIDTVCRLASERGMTVVLVSHSTRDQQAFIRWAKSMQVFGGNVRLSSESGSDVKCLQDA